jgi:quaternary ammonium compound-resistance protein SugE
MYPTLRRDFLMPWAALVFAGVFEIGWPVGLKLAQNGETRVLGIAVALLFMVLSGFLLWTAQKQIPIGTAYAVWTGIGAAGTFIVGAALYGEAVSLMRFCGVGLIIGGVVVLKLAH